MGTIGDRLRQVRDSIREAELACGRAPGSVRLVAVSKFHPAEAVMEAAGCGQLLFGENRVQEAAAKFDLVRAAVPEAELHIIGSLQRNKVKPAVACASCVQSVDRLELLEELEKQAARAGKDVAVMFEFLTGEDSKSGYTSVDELLRSVEYAAASARLRPVGFMTMAPLTSDELAVAAAFRKLVSVRREVRLRFPSLDLPELSMGMSGDYRIAIAEGSTMVRIGTAIFGGRQ